MISKKYQTLCAVFAITAISALNPVFADQLNNDEMLIWGHRGTGITMDNSSSQEAKRRIAGTRGPENTLKAVKLALAGGSDGIEIDVFRTKDNSLAVIHDEKLSTHIDGADGDVDDYTMAQLHNMDAGDGEPIPSLDEIFTLAAQYDDVYVNVELKGKRTYDLAYQTAIQSGYDMDHVIFSSKHKGELKKLSKLSDDLNIGYLFLPSWSNGFSESKVQDMIDDGIKLTSLHIRMDKASNRMINYADDHDMDVIVFTSKEKHPSKSGKTLKFAKAHQDNKSDNVRPHPMQPGDYATEFCRWFDKYAKGVTTNMAAKEFARAHELCC